MSNFIKLDGDKICISLAFDENVVNAVKSIDGRVWNKYTKRWEVPAANVEEVLETMSRFPYFVISPEVKALQAAQADKWNEIDAIRAREPVYNGSLPLQVFQRLGASFLREMPSALLGDVPGLGKSIQVLASHEESPDQMLVWTYNSLKYNFAEEIKKWYPEADVLVIGGTKKQRSEQWYMARMGYFKGGVKVRPRFVIANYELLIHDKLELVDHMWGWIVCDEATRIANHTNESVKILKLMKCKKKIAMTGTPVSNSPEDIFSIYDWICPGYLGSYYQFKKKYCVEEEETHFVRGGGGSTKQHNRITGFKNIDVLREKVGKFMLRRTKEEVLKDFPAKVVENITFDLNDEEKKMYKAIKEQIVKEIKERSLLDTSTLHIIPVMMLRLKQCTGSTALVDDLRGESSTKVNVLKERLESISQNGYKSIVFTQFKEMLYILEGELKDFKTYAIHGDVPAKERQEIVNNFKNDPDARVMLMTEAGAYGLNLQAANYVFHFDFPWSIAKLQQREDRAHRYGQDSTVTVYNLVAKDTIDEYCMKLLDKKRKVSVDVLNDIDRMEESGLSLDDIKAILRI